MFVGFEPVDKCSAPMDFCCRFRNSCTILHITSRGISTDCCLNNARVCRLATGLLARRSYCSSPTNFQSVFSNFHSITIRALGPTLLGISILVIVLLWLEQFLYSDSTSTCCNSPDLHVISSEQHILPKVVSAFYRYSLT